MISTNHGMVIRWRGEEWVNVEFVPAHGPHPALNVWHSRDSFTATCSPDGHGPLGAEIVRRGNDAGIIVDARRKWSIVA